jgi:hypothetical protein
MIKISIYTGAAQGFDKPTICHSGKPKPNACYAVTRSPGREGWSLVKNPAEFSNRDGWWCPDCVKQFQETMAQQGIEPQSSDIPFSPRGAA